MDNLALHCSICNEKVRNITREDAEKLSGNELCLECEKRAPEIAKRKQHLDEKFDGLFNSFKTKLSAIVTKSKTNVQKVLADNVEMTDFGLVARKIKK